MLALALTILLTTISIATALALLDSWLRARTAFDVLKHERALVRAGFVPMADHSEMRLRSGPQGNASVATHRVRSRQIKGPAVREPVAQLAGVLGAA